MARFPQLCHAGIAAFAIFATGCSNTIVENLPKAFLQLDKNYPVSEVVPLITYQCEKPDACPNNIGYMVSSTIEGGKTGVFQCTGFLIAPDIVATNSHCIPKLVKNGTYQCSKAISITFLKDGRTKETRFCGELIEASKIAEKKSDGEWASRPDYAFFRLERPVEAPALKIDQTGIPNDLELIAMTVDPQSKYDLIGQLTKKQCRSVYDHIVFPGASFDTSDITVFAGDNCRIIGGNSGSPVFSKKSGDVVGVAYASFDDLGGYLQKKGFETEGTLDAALLTNFACVKFPNYNGPDSTRCEPTKRAALKTQLAEKFEARMNAPEESIKTWLDKSAGLFAYHLTVKTKVSQYSKRLEVEITPQVRCVLPPEKRNGQNYRTEEKTWGEPKGTILVGPLESKTFHEYLVVDKWGRLKRKVQTFLGNSGYFEIEQAKITSSPQDIGKFSRYEKYQYQTDRLLAGLCSSLEPTEPIVTPVN